MTSDLPTRAHTETGTSISAFRSVWPPSATPSPPTKAGYASLHSLPLRSLLGPAQLQAISALPLNSCRICSPFSSDGVSHLLPGIFSQLSHVCASVRNKRITGFGRSGRAPSLVLSACARRGEVGKVFMGKAPHVQKPACSQEARGCPHPIPLTSEPASLGRPVTGCT